MTPHNNAKKWEIANVVLMPGDPLRAKWIAKEMLEDARLVNKVRGMYCYTGTYKGRPISVMAHGIGIPSIGIYSYELFTAYNVDTIIRIGSTGSYVREIDVNDVVLVNESFSESTYAKVLGVSNEQVLKPSAEINEMLMATANQLDIPLKTVRCNCSDVFYGTRTFEEQKQITGAQVVEMETFGLFANAIKTNKRAAALLTCSDSFVSKRELSPEQRQKTFRDMVKIALETAVQIEEK